jgi:hypothetical protein
VKPFKSLNKISTALVALAMMSLPALSAEMETGSSATSSATADPNAAHPKTNVPNRPYFCKDTNACGVGVDTTGWWIRDQYKIDIPDLNKSYSIYRTSDVKHEAVLGRLQVKNGNGFIDKFEIKPVAEYERMFGKPTLNVFGSAYENRPESGREERNTFVFDFDALDETGSVSKFKLVVYAFDDKNVSEYVIAGPGIVCAQVKDAELASVLQYTPENGVFWVGIRSPQRETTAPKNNAELFALLDRKIAAKQDITPFPRPFDERVCGTGRAERHQKTSPTLPDGAPIPDSR